MSYELQLQWKKWKLRRENYTWLQLKSAYENNLMPYTNYTFDFKGMIDYIFYSKTDMNVLGVLGPLDPQWLVENNITGCPHPHIPSDHFSLLT